MKTIMTLGLVGAIAVLGGCGAPQGVPSIEVVGPEGLKLPADATKACTWPDGTVDVSGTMDIDSTAGTPAYTFFYPFLVENHLQFDATSSPTATSTYDFMAQKVVADYLGTDDATTTALSGLHSEVPGAYTVRAGGTTDAMVELIPANVGQAIASALNIPAGGSKVVLVRFHFAGVLQDGQAATSSDLQYPVTVCNGCLSKLGCPTGDVLVSCGMDQTPIGCVKGP